MSEPLQVPPHSKEIERAVLCMLLSDPDSFDVCAELTPSAFYVQTHADVFAAILAVRARGLTPDTITVPDQLEIGGAKYLDAIEQCTEITSKVIPTHKPEEHVREIIELAQRRNVIRVCMNIAARGYDRSILTSDFFEDAERKILAATSVERAGAGFTRMNPVAMMERFQAAHLRQALTGLPTGLASLDKKLDGLKAGKLYIVAGRPGMGKSSLALGMARAVAKSDRVALMVSLEMDNEECDVRFASLASGVPGVTIERGLALVADQPWRLGQAAQEMEIVPFLHDDTPSLAIPRIRARVRREMMRHGKIGVIVVDHLGLARSGMNMSSREQEVSEISRSLKEMAKEFNCPVVALAQLNRECEKRPDKRPQLSDLRDSGSIEQDADVIVFVYRRGYYAAEMKAGRIQTDTSKWAKPSTIEAGDDDGKAELIIAKHRGGPKGIVHCDFHGEAMRFLDQNHKDPVQPYDPIGGAPDDSDGDGEPFTDDDFSDRRWPT